MSKTLGSWSAMRKYLEEQMLAPELRGRVRYGCSTAVGMDGCRFFEIYIDGRCFKRFSWETVNSYFIAMGYAEKPDPMSIRDYWEDFWPLLEKYPMSARTEYTDGEFCRALQKYRSAPISESLRGDDPIALMFALLDRRTGRRTLERLRCEARGWPEWLREVYALREGKNNSEQ